MNTYLLTSPEYVNLHNVSFVSEAPTEVLQETLKDKGFKITLNQLLEELIFKGYGSENRKK